jgi:hypothetical protein
VIYEFVRTLVFFLSLGVAEQDARDVAAEVTLEQAHGVCAVMAAGDPDPLDPWLEWAADGAVEKAGCTPIPGSFDCRGTTCSVKCSLRRCCTRVWDAVNKRWRQVCVSEIDPSTCVAQPLPPIRL